MASRVVLPVILASTLCVIPLGAQQPTDRFELVSLRRAPSNCPPISLTVVRCPDTPPRSFRLFAGRLEASSVSTLDMIRVAYGYEGLVEGVSRWVSHDRYELIGITGDRSNGTVSDSPQTRRQLQALLADRFGLRLDTASMKSAQVRILKNAGTSGTGLRPAAGPCSTTAPVGRAPSMGSQCDVKVIGHGLEARGITMADLARALSVRLSDIVVDETGFTGYFDVSLVTRYDGTELVLDLESQLGLTLLEGKRPVPVLAIKDVKKPVED